MLTLRVAMAYQKVILSISWLTMVMCLSRVIPNGHKWQIEGMPEDEEARNSTYKNFGTNGQVGGHESWTAMETSTKKFW